MLLVDCKGIRSDNGVSPDGKRGTPLMGDVAARILDLAGIVLNRNTIPGDRSARNPSGIRLGTPWVTQRGFRTPEIKELAQLIARALEACSPYAFAGRQGPVYRAKVNFDTWRKSSGMWWISAPVLTYHATMRPVATRTTTLCTNQPATLAATGTSLR